MRWIERALNLRSGDLGRGALLCSCLFLIITSYVVGKVAGDALFLAHFNARSLPYADILSAFVVALVISAYVRFGRRLSLVKVLVSSMVFFASNCLLFWVLSYTYRPSWLYPAFYIWVKTFGVLAPAQIWTLANHVLTSREAKRVLAWSEEEVLPAGFSPACFPVASPRCSARKRCWWAWLPSCCYAQS